MMTTAGRVLSVLLVDDDDGDLLMIREALDSGTASHEVHVVHDGEEALEFLRRQGRYPDAPRPDLVLLDLNMPRMDGRQVLAAVKADEELRKIPIIVLTTSRAPADIVSSYDLHANAYVAKPMSLDDLTAVVKGIDDFFGSIADLPRANS